MVECEKNNLQLTYTYIGITLIAQTAYKKITNHSQLLFSYSTVIDQFFYTL